MAPIVGPSLRCLALFNVGPVFNESASVQLLRIVAASACIDPKAKAAWYLIAVGMALFVSGDIFAYNFQRFFGRPLPFPWIADVVYLGVFPALIAGLLLLIRARNRGGDRSSLIDSLIIGIGVGLLMDLPHVAVRTRPPRRGETHVARVSIGGPALAFGRRAPCRGGGAKGRSST